MASTESPVGIEIIQESRADQAITQLSDEGNNGSWRDILESSLEVHGGIDYDFVSWVEGRFGIKRASDVIEALLGSIAQSDLDTAE
jgi:hypothetical protein